MFRAAAASPIEEAVVKATDENLTSEPWDRILEVCDLCSSSPEGPQKAIASIIRRLSHRNANVQIYTLELANALSQNCGPPLHRELASKAFTDALLRLAADRNTHGQVKQKVMERMSAWSEQFGRNPDLGIMEQAYQKLRVQQPGLVPPSKPVKREISSEDKRKEEEELQMALALSIKDKGAETSGQAPNGTSRDDSQAQPAQSQATSSQGQQGTTAATVSRVRALYDFTPSEPGELAFRKNDVIAVLESVYKDWWRGSLRGQSGIFPLNYVEKLQDPTKEELERDASMEAEVFGEIKSVEKLLALLSVKADGSGGRRGEREEEEISELYQRTLSIRPKLIELIGKYSQKKDDFTQLNEKFIKARRDYEALLESSMSQSQYSQQYPIRPHQPPQMYPPQQRQQQYIAPQQVPHGYPPQGPPPAQGYPPQQPFAQQSQQRPPPQQDVQRYHSPAPSERPGPGPGPQPGYSNQYAQQSGAPPPQSANGPAPFHFIPGGLQGAQAGQQQQQQPAPQQQQQPEIRRKPSPQPPLSAGPGPGAAPNAHYSEQRPFQTQQPPLPNTIQTLNNGNPQELATSGYESPIDNRHSYPNPMSPPSTYDSYAQQQQQQQQQPSHPPQQPPFPLQQQAPYAQQLPNDLNTLPSRQRTHSFESPTSTYSTQRNSTASWAQEGPPSPAMLPQGGPYHQQQQQQGYMAYQPQQQQQGGQRVASAGGSGADSAGGGGEDPGDYYR